MRVPNRQGTRRKNRVLPDMINIGAARGERLAHTEAHLVAVAEDLNDRPATDYISRNRSTDRGTTAAVMTGGPDIGPSAAPQSTFLSRARVTASVRPAAPSLVSRFET